MTQLIYIVAFTAAPFIVLVLPYVVLTKLRLRRESKQVEFRAKLIYGDSWEKHVGTIWS